MRGGKKSTNLVNLVDLIRSRNMLKNACLESLDAKIGVDTAENGPAKARGPKCGFGARTFAENFCDHQNRRNLRDSKKNQL